MVHGNRRCKKDKDTEHIKTQIRLVSWSWPSVGTGVCTCLYNYRPMLCSSCEFVHMSLCLFALCLHSAGCICLLLLSDRIKVQKKKKGGTSTGMHLLSTTTGWKTTSALHYTVLLTTSRASSLRGNSRACRRMHETNHFYLGPRRVLTNRGCI